MSGRQALLVARLHDLPRLPRLPGLPDWLPAAAGHLTHFKHFGETDPFQVNRSGTTAAAAAKTPLSRD